MASGSPIAPAAPAAKDPAARRTAARAAWEAIPAEAAGGPSEVLVRPPSEILDAGGVLARLSSAMESRADAGRDDLRRECAQILKAALEAVIRRSGRRSKAAPGPAPPPPAPSPG